MLSTGDFDILFQFKQDVINDILIRVLNESPLTNLHLKSPISRLIEQPIPTAEVKAYWDKPDLALSDDNTISLSVEVNGGARQIITQRILTLSGSISITRKALLVAANDGTFFLHLASPQPLDLHMSKLHATYAGSRWPDYLSAIDPTREISALRPVLTYELMYPLTNLPLSYDVGTLPLRFAPSNSFRPTSSSGWIIPVKATDLHLVKTTETEVVAIGVSLTNDSCDASRINGTFPKGVECNASITLTSSGMNVVLEQLRRQNALVGIIQSTSRAQQVSWRWESLTVAFHNDYISLAGNLRMNATVTHVTADLYCFVDQYGYLTITPRAITTNDSIAETIIASWSTVLRMILRARDKNQRNNDRNDQYKLFQRFTISGTLVAVEAIAVALLIEEGALTLFYDIPKASEGFHAEIPLHKPKVAIIQPRIPVQMAKGAPVSIEMQAQLTAQSYPPYDYVWSTDLTQGPAPDRGQSMKVTGVPTTTATGNGLQALTNTHVKVIDMFGQDVDASAPALYKPASDHHDRTRRRLPDHPHRLVSTLLIVAVAIVVIVTSGIGAALAILQPSLSLSGSSSVVSGGTMLLHGRNFVPGSSVTLTLDNGLPLAYTGHGPAGESLYGAESITALQLLVVGRLAQSISANTPIPVNSLGQFDVSIRVSESWSPEIHTIHALDSILGRSAELQFTIVAKPPPLTLTVIPASLTESPPSLNFGTLNPGTSKVLTLQVGNSGGQPLTWNAGTGSANWLTLDMSTGTIQPDAQEKVKVTADSSQVGKYSTTLNITSNGGNVQVPVTLIVTAQPSPRVGGATLGGCSYAAGLGWTCTTTVTADASNQADLSWTTSYSGVGGTTFTPSTGTLPPGQSKSVGVIVPDDECPNSFTFTFFGPVNNASVTYNCPAPTLTVNPTSEDTNTCMSVEGGNGFQCTVTLMETSDSQGYVQWSADSDVKATFSPQNGQLSPNGSVPVTITIPSTNCVNGNGKGTITFSQAPGVNPATVTWFGECPIIK